MRVVTLPRFSLQLIIKIVSVFAIHKLTSKMITSGDDSL